MGLRLLRLYQSEKGIWRYDFERDGKMYWSSLRTRSERIARKRYEHIGAYTERANMTGPLK